MNSEDQLFELMTKMYGEMQEGFKEVKERVGNLENRMVKMEDDNHKNFTALFDGYKQNTEQLHRIEKEVSKHEEVIIRRVK
ncbi:MAG TPA: hypothetical protein VFC79_11590 [Tissierellaceae bacterium]|nr:hypothetical protein [Tissierellaceae bacterium]